MKISLQSGQIAQEAKQALAKLNARRKSLPAKQDYRIMSHSRDAYRPPHFVRSTATASQHDGLCDILRQVWVVNEEHVGESFVELAAYFTLTAPHTELEDRITSWCGAYVAERLKKWHPKDRGHPFRKFVRLYEEFLNVLGMRERTLDELYLDKGRQYAIWRLFEATWANTVKLREVDGGYRLVGSDPLTTGHGVLYVRRHGLGRNGLARFIRMFGPATAPPKLSELASQPDEELRRTIESTMDTIHQMRPFLVRNFSPEKAILSPAEGLFISMDWLISRGVIELPAATTQRGLRSRIASGSPRPGVLVRTDGRLIDRYRPWITAHDIHVEGVNSPAVNAYVLELLCDRLREFYGQIDFDRIRRRAETHADDDIEDDALALSCQDLATSNEEAEPESKPNQPSYPDRLRPLRPQQMLRFLEREFGCEIRNGKGSEVTIYRAGAKKYRLGHPKQVQPEQLKRILRNLNIPTRAWWVATNRRFRNL